MTTSRPATEPVLRIVLPCLPPKEYSANVSRGAAWQRQYRVSHGKRGAIADVVALVRQQGWQGPALAKACIKVTFILPDRRKRDPGGLQERMKPWFDGLKEAGVIVDDDLASIGWPEYHDDYSKNNPQTIIEVRPSDMDAIERALRGERCRTNNRCTC